MAVHFCTVFHVSGYTGHDFLKCFACRMNIHSRMCVCVCVCVCTSLFSIALKTFYRVCMYREKRERKREKEGGEE